MRRSGHEVLGARVGRLGAGAAGAGRVRREYLDAEAALLDRGRRAVADRLFRLPRGHSPAQGGGRGPHLLASTGEVAARTPGRADFPAAPTRTVPSPLAPGRRRCTAASPAPAP